MPDESDDIDRRIAAAVADYEARVERNEPYEDTLDAEELRKRYR